MADVVKRSAMQEREGTGTSELSASELSASGSLPEVRERPVSLEEIVARARRDAADSAERYLEETRVPFGGE